MAKNDGIEDLRHTLEMVVHGSTQMLDVAPRTLGIPDNLVAPAARAILFLHGFHAGGSFDYPGINSYRVAGVRFGADRALGRLVVCGLRGGCVPVIAGSPLTGLVAKHLSPPDRAAVLAEAKLWAGSEPDDTRVLGAVEGLLAVFVGEYRGHLGLQRDYNGSSKTTLSIPGAGSELPHARLVADLLFDAGYPLYLPHEHHEGMDGDY